MKKVALRLGMINDSSSSAEINSAVARLQGKVHAEKISNTSLIRITASSPNSAQEAIDLANIVAEVYIEEGLLQKSRQYSQARKFIQNQIDILELKQKETEEHIRKFGEEIKNIDFAAPIQQRLVELGFNLAELLQRYTDKYPKVIEIKEEIKSLEAQLKGFSGQELEYARLKRESEINKKLYAMFKEKLEETRIAEAGRVGDVSVVDPAISASAPVTRRKPLGILGGITLGLTTGMILAFILETLDTSISTIEDVENLVKLPVLGVIPSLEEERQKAGGGMLARFRRRFKPYDKSEAEERFVRLVTHYKPRSPAAEAYHNIRTNLKLNTSKKTIMVTSSGPREGKSTIAINLGIVMAQSGLKTLLVSADMRRSVLAKTFGVKKEPGLNEILMGTINLEKALGNITDIIVGEMKFEEIRKTPGLENIWILPSGKLPPNPVRVLESKELAPLIEKLRSRFDIIIFDVPPVLPVTDASILAPRMDCVVIVYEMGKMSREALLRTKIQLESVGGKISGVVLNHTKPQVEAAGSYPYYYRYKYRYYYGKEEPVEAKSKSEKV
jgi:tyrosine-protein kinase Etk/Wzc